MLRDFWTGVAMLIGTSIGAGVFGIPYVVAKAGFWTGLLCILLIGVIFLLVNLSLAEVLLRTRGKHQLCGLAGKYLGVWGSRFMAVSMVVGIFAALIAYTLGSGLALFEVFGVSSWFWSVVFYVVCVGVALTGVEGFKRGELWANFVKLCLFVVIAVLLLSSKEFSVANLSGFDLSSFFVPWGVVIFAYLCTSIIPEVRFGIKKLSYIKNIVIVGSVVPILVYVLFAVGVVGVTGINTTEVATVGVGLVLGKFAGVLFNLFAVLAMATAFVALSFALADMFMLDWRLSKSSAWGVVITVPVLLVLLGVHSFISVLDFSGEVSGGLVGLLVGLMVWKARKLGDRKPEFVVPFVRFLVPVFVLIFAFVIVRAFLGIL